jgi:predicted transcriptional regulator
MRAVVNFDSKWPTLDSIATEFRDDGNGSLKSAINNMAGAIAELSANLGQVTDDITVMRTTQESFKDEIQHLRVGVQEVQIGVRDAASLAEVAKDTAARIEEDRLVTGPRLEQALKDIKDLQGGATQNIRVDVH